MTLISHLFKMIWSAVVFVSIIFTVIYGGARAEPRERPVSTIQDVFKVLKTCWIPPPKNAARVGMQITVRFSVTRTGEMFGKPKITFETKKATDAQRIAYRIAVMSMLQRCTPIPVTDALGNAIAGHPLSIRLIDERQQRRAATNRAAGIISAAKITEALGADAFPGDAHAFPKRS